MTRISLLIVLGLVVAVGCNKPSDSACRKAIANMRSLMGTDGPTSNTDVEGDIRRCKGGSTRKAVDCAGNATTLDQLRACDFMKFPSRGSGAGSGSAAGSATGAAIDAGAGSDMGSAMGSGAGSDMGSAGSAGPASGGSGSAIGSAAAAGSSATTGAGSAESPAAAGSAGSATK